MTEERYIDPNSGAAPQPGGFAAPAAVQAPQATESEVNPVVDTEREHQAAPSGDQVADPDAQTRGEEPEGDEPDGGELDSGGEPEREEDYSELLSQNVDEIERYVEEHPEEKEAIKAAEQERDRPRKGVLEL